MLHTVCEITETKFAKANFGHLFLLSGYRGNFHFWTTKLEEVKQS